MTILSQAAVLPASAGPSGAFAPNLLPGLQGWWDASDVATIVFGTGSNVAQWNDKSGGGHHFTQATDAKRPDRVNTQNGLGVLTFVSATQDSMDTGSYTVAQPMTVFQVAKYASSVASAYVSSIGGNLGIGYTSGGHKLFYAGSAEIQIDVGNTAWHTLSYVMNGASSASWQDGTPGGTGNPGASGTTTGFRLAERGFNFWSDCDLGELIIYDSALSVSNRQKVETYLKAKWATP